MPTCLLVTSEPATQREFSTMVRLLGFEVSLASSVQEAIDGLRAKPMAVIVVDEWWSTGEDPMNFLRQVPHRNRPAIVVVQKVRVVGLSYGAEYAVHRDDPSGLREALAAIELRTHEQALESAEPQLQEAAE